MVKIPDGGLVKIPDGDLVMLNHRYYTFTVLEAGVSTDSKSYQCWDVNKQSVALAEHPVHQYKLITGCLPFGIRLLTRTPASNMLPCQPSCLPGLLPLPSKFYLRSDHAFARTHCVSDMDS
eukprot:748778-Pelagomonas_calceolata.AAC.3